MPDPVTNSWKGGEERLNPVVAVKVHLCQEKGIKSAWGGLSLAACVAKASKFKNKKLKAA